MIFAPPGSAKTTYVSRLLIPWVMQRKPDWAIIGASHRALFANENSGIAIGYIREYGSFLGLKLLSEATERWRACKETIDPETREVTRQTSGYLAAGLDAGISGFRADLAIIDDPIKSRSHADSPVYREKAWKWFNSDLGRRIKPSGRIILMHTRWHEDDMAGRLLRTQKDRWRVLNLPALASSPDDPLGRELGAPLWDDDDYAYGSGLVEIRDELEKAGAALDWSSLYQQDPRPAEGALFKTHNIETINAIPHGTTWVRAWDLAATKDMGTASAAYTAGVKLGRMPDGNFLVGDAQRERLPPEGMEKLIVTTAQRDTPVCKIGLPQDPGQAGKFQVAYMAKVLAGFSVLATPESGDKQTRAGPFASQVNVGNVKILAGPWNKAYLEELRSFPVGLTADQVDASSRAFSMIYQSGAALWAALGRRT